jgi:phosphopantothenoylcysteine decarboxylase/phosphopantothenate--cysteine ligase
MPDVRNTLAKILLTSGPTRQYLDPVRYLTNASSGRMGAALAECALALGHDVTVVSGPVEIEYPKGARVVPVITTQEMLAAATEEFTTADGLIGVAAPCDYQPQVVESQKIQKTGAPLVLHLIETPDIVATLGASKKPNQWCVGFALETSDARFRAIVKMQKKSCDLMVVNGPDAMNSLDNRIELLNRGGEVLSQCAGPKNLVAAHIMQTIERLLIKR